MVGVDVVDAGRSNLRYTMKKILMTLLVISIMAFGVGMLSPRPAFAAVTDCNRMFLTFRPWYYNLTKGAPECAIKDINAEGINTGTEIDLEVFIWAVILNILSILFSAVGYFALGFLIYGGYQYVLARGDSGRVAKGKRTVVAAITGLVICILASLLANTLVTIITGAVGV